MHLPRPNSSISVPGCRQKSSIVLPGELCLSHSIPSSGCFARSYVFAVSPSVQNVRERQSVVKKVCLRQWGSFLAVFYQFYYFHYVSCCKAEGYFGVPQSKHPCGCAYLVFTISPDQVIRYGRNFRLIHYTVFEVGGGGPNIQASRPYILKYYQMIVYTIFLDSKVGCKQDLYQMYYIQYSTADNIFETRDQM